MHLIYHVIVVLFNNYCVIIISEILQSAMQHQKLKYLPELNYQDIKENQLDAANQFLDIQQPSPKKKRIPIETQNNHSRLKKIEEQSNKIVSQQALNAPIAVEDKKLRSLIIDAISSADRAVKAILPYGHAEIQKYCSVYFLNKQKLYSFLESTNHSLFINRGDQVSKKVQTKKARKPILISDESIEMVPINHLQRLEKIVYNKVIPILQNDFESQKRRSQKHLKKGKDWATNSQLKEGLLLLERLNEKERIAVDQCAEILERFIGRIMEKQEKMANKLNRMQQKLNQQIKKTQILADQSKKWQQLRLKMQKQWQKQKKIMHKYQQFARQMQNIIIQKDKIDPKTPQKELLDHILQVFSKYQQKIKHKKCDHRSQKQIHAVCKEESSRNQQQIKSLKDVVKSLDKQICLLRDQCQSMQMKLKNSNDKIYKFQNKSKKIIQQNESMNNKIEELMREESYKGKLIQQYLRIIGRLQQSLKNNQQNIARLNEQNEGYLQLLTKYSSEKENYIKHILQIEEKEKQLEEIIAHKQAQIEEMITTLNCKQREVHDYQSTIQKIQNELNQLERINIAKQQIIEKHLKDNHRLEKEVKTLQIKIQNIKSNQILEKQLSIMCQKTPQKTHKSAAEIEINNLNSEKRNRKFQTLQVIKCNNLNREQQQTTISLDGKLIKISAQKLNLLNALDLYSQKNELQYLRLNQEQKKQLSSICHLLQTLFFRKQNEQKLIENVNDDRTSLQINHQKLVQKSNNNEKQFLPAQIIEPRNINIQQNLKGTDRDDFIPAIINKQSHPQIENQKVEYLTLQEELNQFSNIQPDKQNQKNQAFTQNLQQTKELQNFQKKQQKAVGESVEAEPAKIQQLLDLNQRIGQNFIKLKQKIEKQEYCQELAQLKQEIDYMAALLNLYKRNTLKKLQKIKTTELLHKQAQEQIQRLKQRLDDAVISNQPFSSIHTDSEGSGFTLPDHLQSYFKHNNPFTDHQIFTHNHLYPIKPKPSREFFTQTQQEPSLLVKRQLPAVPIESLVIIKTSSPEISEIHATSEAQVNKSFIEYLNIGSQSPQLPDKTEKTPRSIGNSGDLKGTNLSNVLKEIQVDEQNHFEQQKQVNRNHVNQIASMIQYHKAQIFDLHKILRAQTEEIKKNEISDLNNELQTPKRNIFDNQNYINYWNNAPQKKQIDNQKTSKSQIFNERNQNNIQQHMKQILAEREQQFSQLLTEKQEEIQRLKSIIKKLTTIQQIEENTNSKISKNRQSNTRQFQNLKNQNQQLWMFLQKQKSQIQRLHILIQQYQLQDQLARQKSRQYTNRHINNQTQEKIQLLHGNIEQEQGILNTFTPIKNQLKIDVIKREDQKTSLIDDKQPVVNILEEKQYFQVPFIQKRQTSPKRFTRKSQKFENQKSPRQPRNTFPSSLSRFEWEELVPQYFGKSSSPKKQKKN